MFGSIFETYDVVVETYIEDRLVNRQQIEAPKEVLMMSFVNNAQQLGNDRRPIKMVMSRPDTIWDNFEQKEKSFNHEVVFKNNAMIAWEESKNEVM